jgi:hypothetical protein
MTKENIQQILNIRNNNFYNVINDFVKYVNVYENKVALINAIVLKSKANKNLTSLDMFKYFYEELESLVIGTVYCPSKYNAQMFLKTVWEKSSLQSYVVQQIRQGYKIIELPKKQEIPDNETTKQERLRLQAEKMRAAKAKKAAEKKAIEDATKQKKQETVVKQQKLLKEHEEQIKLLRNLKL